VRRHGIVAALATTAALGTLVSAAAGAGPAPGGLEGAPGIAVAGQAHVVATPAAGKTRVQLVRDRDGRVLRARVLPGTLGVPQTTILGGDVEGTWANGRRLMLSTSIYDDAASTKFVVLDTRTLATRRTIALRGAFAFDALSPDGRRLYVTQFPNGLSGTIRYVVRSLTVATGRLDPGSIVDRTEPAEQMAGMPMVRTWSRDGATAFTLYNGLEGHAFVHALDTTRRTARCIDLPWQGEAQNGLERARMTVGADGVLVISLPGTGVLARIDTRTFAVEIVRAPA
jgi:hypothetical protein